MRHEDEQFAAAARCIADELCAQARSDDDSAHWLTASFEPGARRAEWHALPDLYGGAAGIALFLLEAGHVLSSSRYTEMALAGLQWSDRHVPAWLPYGFYSGRLGIAFAFLRAHLVTGDSRWLERALAL